MQREYVRFLIGFGIGAVLVFMFGCAPSAAVIRLGPGECVVIEDRQAIVTAGAGDCQLRRLYR